MGQLQDISPIGQSVIVKFQYAMWVLDLADDEDVPEAWREWEWREWQPPLRR